MIFMRKTDFSRILTLISLLFLMIFAGCSKKAEKSPQTKIPGRIITLSPSATEILYAVGAENQIVAVSDFSDFPERAREKPAVGGFDGKTLSLEKILSLEPDFVYMTRGMHDFLVEPLESCGIACYLSFGDSIQAVLQEIEEISFLTGHQEEGREVIAKIRREIAGIAEFGREITVFYEVWNSPFMSPGSRSFIHDVISAAGGTNIFGDVDEPYPLVSEEAIIARAPDVILLTRSNGITPEQVRMRPGWQEIPAVKNSRIFIIDDAKFSRPATRIGECVQELNSILAG